MIIASKMDKKKIIIIGLIALVIIAIIYYMRKKKSESAFRGGRGHGHRHGGGWRRPGGWGYPYYAGFGYPYDYFNEPVIIENKKCPEGFVYRGEKEGCKKISELKIG